MSLDYPDYAELKKRNRRLAVLWSAGDFGYYFSLLGAVIGPVSMLTATSASLERRLVGAGVLFAIFVAIFLLSNSPKAFARKKGGVSNPH
jgi:uncharacterized membrane protein (DUF485 family)